MLVSKIYLVCKFTKLLVMRLAIFRTNLPRPTSTYLGLTIQLPRHNYLPTKTYLPRPTYQDLPT